MQYDRGPMPRVLLRLVELDRYKVRKHCYIYLLLRSLHFIMIITRAHARRPRRVRSIYNVPSVTSASATCTSISDSASPAHARFQLEAQVEFYGLTIQPLMQMSGSGKDQNYRFESTVYARYLACHLRCAKRRGHLFLLPFFRVYVCRDGMA
jgi:hypothetical protein